MNRRRRLFGKWLRVAKCVAKPREYLILTGILLLIFVTSAGGEEGSNLRLNDEKLSGLESTTIAVEERYGERFESYPVNIGVPIPAEMPVGNVWLARVGEEGVLEPVAFQIFEVLDPDWHEGSPARRPVKVIDIVFLADYDPGEEVRFRLYYGEEIDDLPEPEPERSLSIEARQGLARSIDTGPVEFQFHDKSGQLLDYKLAAAGQLVGFWSPDDPRPIHHNPDVWAPPQAWGHTSGWDIESEELAPEYAEAEGPLAWRSVRKGHITRSNETEAVVTYTAFAGLPVLLESSSLRFTRNTTVNAVRNNELVFRRGLHTHAVYIDHDGAVHTFRVFDPGNPEKCFAHIGRLRLPPDIPFVGLFHESRGYGIGMVTMEYSTHSMGGIASSAAGSAHYYYCDIKGRDDPDHDFTYFCRGVVFNTDFCYKRLTWQRHRWNTTVVPAGALYAERSAILAFEVDPDRNGEEDAFGEVERWTRLLRRPPGISIIDGIDSRQ